MYDDGISGTTFDRADFNKLVKLIENNQANMVITKDLSRLGRDHVETDNYIEKWFPEHNVRYVSILESVDTYDADNVSNDIAPLINWSNDQFAKTTSKKIRKELKKMMHQGKWSGGAIKSSRTSRSSVTKTANSFNITEIITIVITIRIYLPSYYCMHNV